jgi:hypothetical protein
MNTAARRPRRQVSRYWEAPILEYLRARRGQLTTMWTMLNHLAREHSGYKPPTSHLWETRREIMNTLMELIHERKVIRYQNKSTTFRRNPRSMIRISEKF